MRVNLGQDLRNMDNEPLIDNDRPLTLGRVCMNALLAIDPKQTMPGEEKARRYRLAVLMVDSDSAELAAEDVALIKSAVGVAYAPLIVGQAWNMLEGVNGYEST